MDAGVVAIIGGAAGSVLSGLVRALGVPSEVRFHDASVADRDDQLATWVADRDYALKRVCEAHRRTVRTPNRQDVALQAASALVQSGGELTSEQTLEQMERAMYVKQASDADQAIAQARRIALHEYRDEARRARLNVATILASEGWPHRWWRKLSSSLGPGLTTPERAKPVLDSWRSPSGMNPEKQTWPDDATKRTLEDALSSINALGP
jgi:hypothetical protein